MEIYSHSPEGYDGELVRVETDLRRGIPGFDLTGLAGAAVREARERVRAAIRNSGFIFPLERILINLSPSDIRKSGSGFDLALALSLLIESDQVSGWEESLMALGELQLDGRVRPVPGVLSAAVAARKAGITFLLISRENAQEASVLEGIKILAVDHLSQLKDLVSLEPYKTGEKSNFQCQVPHSSKFPDIRTLKGQKKVKRALMAVAAGGHNLFLLGPPGSGKTLAARTLAGLLPEWSQEESLETTRLWSLAGRMESRSGLLPCRPFRHPHHSASAEGLLGGGQQIRPGEISLAHQGVLFLDEAPEFKSDLLQGLREPLEEGQVQISRAGRFYQFPAAFQLVLAANPCPCGQTGRSAGWCSCSPVEKGSYIKKLGGALLDRLDLRIEVSPSSPEELALSPDDDTTVLKNRIREARLISLHRPGGLGLPNARLTHAQLRTMPECGSDLFTRWSRSTRSSGFSSRGLIQIWRLARTLADLDSQNCLNDDHLEEAWELRGGKGGQFGWF